VQQIRAGRQSFAPPLPIKKWWPSQHGA
jgi:hypothetical protein